MKNISKDPQFKTINKMNRCGKFEAQKTGTCYAQGDIIIFTDCSAILNSSSVIRIAKHFRDPKIGAVSGVYKTVNSNETSRAKGEGAYWKYEMGIRNIESKIQTITHATGALYAIKKIIAQDCFLKNHQRVINDDLFLPLWTLEMGYQVKSERQAIATEYVDTDPAKDFSRRIRIAKGNLSLWKESFILISRHRYFAAFQFLSHKLLRNFQGTFILPLFLINIILLTINPIYMLVFGLQVIFYSLALLGTHKFHSKIINKLASIPYYFTLANIAGASATLSLLFTNDPQTYLWNKADSHYSKGA
jgi:cellulose synthase/poly-beta-1,6-N-acetylglucosamine synthase-like glycosyltransferase